MVASVDRRILAGAGLAGIGALLLANPSINGMSLIPTCPLKALTGLDCPLCGGTRAVRSLLAGDVPGALDQNVLVTVGALLALLAGAWWLVSRARPDLRFESVTVAISVRATVVVGGAALAVFFIVRNLPGVPYLQSGIG